MTKLEMFLERTKSAYKEYETARGNKKFCEVAYNKYRKIGLQVIKELK